MRPRNKSRKSFAISPMQMALVYKVMTIVTRIRLVLLSHTTVTVQQMKKKPSFRSQAVRFRTLSTSSS
jgi:hypothetical protein